MSSEEEETACLAPTQQQQQQQQQPATSGHTIPVTTKIEEVRHILKNISLDSFFEIGGHTIGSYPLAFIIAGLILCSLSFGLTSLHLKDNVRDGYTPSDSRSRQETVIYRQFLGSHGDPTMTTLLMKAKDNGSMHRLEYLTEAVQQLVYISKNLSINDGDQQIGYENFCGHYCMANQAVPFFLLTLNQKLKNESNIELTYPIVNIMDYKLHLERNFIGVKTTENSTITNIEHIELISMTFLAEVKTEQEIDNLNAWELKLYEYCQEYTAEDSNDIEMLVIGAEIVDTEMNKDGQRMAPYFGLGFILMVTFVFITVVGSALYFNRCSPSILLVALGCALVPISAITTTLGLNNYMGNRTNSLMLIMPFLVMGIGVNDSFLTLHSWLRQPLLHSPSQRLGRVLQEVGPSISTTTLTNVVTFIIGWMSPTEEISIFCLGSAFALGFAYIYTIVLFCPILFWCSPPQSSSPEVPSALRQKLRNFFKTVLRMHSQLLANRLFGLVLLALTIVYWTFGIRGTLNMSARLDTAKILPKESPVLRPNGFLENMVWNEFYPVTIIVNNPIDLDDSNQVALLRQMVAEFESMTNCRGSEYTSFWLRDYDHYFNGIATQVFDYDEEEVSIDDRKFGYSKFAGFLESPVYKYNKAFLNVDMNERVMIRKSSLLVVFENTTSWDNRIELMLQWRDLVDRYPSLNASVWNVNAMFVDQMLSLKYLTIQNSLATLACMAVVCFIFIQNPVSVFLATFSIASISLGVMGYLSLWGLDLDPVSLCAILISIGMAVDFVAHTACHYQKNRRHKLRDGKDITVVVSTPYERIHHTILSIAWPMSQGGISTVLCILPLVISQNYIPLVFVKTITLVVSWGLIHGLVLLPALFAQMPTSWMSHRPIRALLRDPSSRTHKSAQEMHLLQSSQA